LNFEIDFLYRFDRRVLALPRVDSLKTIESNGGHCDSRIIKNYPYAIGHWLIAE